MVMLQIVIVFFQYDEHNTDVMGINSMRNARCIVIILKSRWVL